MVTDLVMVALPKNPASIQAIMPPSNTLTCAPAKVRHAVPGVAQSFVSSPADETYVIVVCAHAAPVPRPIIVATAKKINIDFVAHETFISFAPSGRSAGIGSMKPAGYS